MIRCLIPKSHQLELAIEMKREFKDDHSWETLASATMALSQVVSETLGGSPTTMHRVVVMSVTLCTDLAPQGRLSSATKL